MSTYETIISVYPELLEDKSIFIENKIVIQDDCDGLGDYILSWNYSKPIPQGLKLGK
jgi:hypothetical protein